MKNPAYPTQYSIDLNWIQNSISVFLDGVDLQKTEGIILMFIMDFADKLCYDRHQLSEAFINFVHENDFKELPKWISYRESLLATMADVTRQLDEVMLYFRRDYIVTKVYRINSLNMQMMVSFDLKVPTRDYLSVLSAEVDEAILAGEEVPLKYLEILGRL